jgi:hypothetical protein
MKRLIYLPPLLTLLSHADSFLPHDKKSYIRHLEQENNISYERILNTRGAYITPMCYTRTQDEGSKQISNPCYSCHTKGKEPNFINDSDLQLVYNFPEQLMRNPYSNLFKDRSDAVSAISDTAIEAYVNRSNYFDEKGSIALQKSLPQDWQGYRPDCYYRFDDLGFDRSPDGGYSGWRAFRYHPFLGTFWPTNGSSDDVLIRLAEPFRENSQGNFDPTTYRLNLAIVEALVKQKDIELPEAVDEKKYGVDLDQNGRLGQATKILFNPRDHFGAMSYVGRAKELLRQGKLHLAGGLFPEGTEFLHSVRYLAWDPKAGQVTLAKRIKELRYAKKNTWMSYSELKRAANAEFREAIIDGTEQTPLEIWYGDYEKGLQTGSGWVYQGFIEDKKGALRPQTHEETIYCMGCHGGIGATTDSIFAFPRKLEGAQSWKHWSQKGLKGVPEPRAEYLGLGKRYEYSFYLHNNHSGNEFRNNDEVQKSFFDANGSVKREMLSRLHKDISLLLLPSKARALKLDKAYKVIVDEQSYIYGRTPHVEPLKNVYSEIKEGQGTYVEKPIIRIE